MAPMIKALDDVTLPHPAALPTGSARALFNLMPVSGFPNFIQDTSMDMMAPAAVRGLCLQKSW